MPVEDSSTSATPASPPPAPDRLTAIAVRFEAVMLRRALIVGALGLLVMIGLFLSNFSIDKARWYWSAMFPIFGIACVWHELAGGRAQEVALWKLLLRQAMHWLVPIFAVRIVFLQHERGQLSGNAVALVVLILLAVTCFLAGLHFDSSFIWVSVFLGLAALFGTEIETYLWLGAVLTVIAVALAVLSSALLRRHKSAPAPAG
ncbi:MAG: hypothetical protein ACLQDV_16310 [Candidatus Binataceae bacterium]